MTRYDETVALCALNKIFGYHPRLAMDLMEAAGSASAVFDRRDLPVPGHPELAEQLGPAMLDWAAGELERIRGKGFRFLGFRTRITPPRCGKYRTRRWASI